jgi:branched-chain amino acid transport system permease protein
VEQLVQTILNGLTTGALYCCIAIGFTLIFGIIQLIYFAQCEMAMIGAFSFAWAYGVFRPLMPTPLALVLAMACAGIFAAGISCLGQRLLLHPIRNAPKVKGLIVSLGLAIVLQNTVLLCISPNDLRFPLQTDQKWMFGEVAVTHSQLWVMTVSVVTWLLVWALLYRTRLGRSIRAVAQSREGALLMGIPVDRVVSITFALAAFTAAIAGVLMGVYNGQMRFDMGFVPGIKGFTVAILGGVGNIRGALLAGVILGVVEGLFAGYLSSDYKDVFAFVLLIVILVVRPHGLLGEKA